MSEMIERVARAIYESRPRNKPWEILGQHQGIYLKAARAAIEAMMEPTEAMMNAAPAVGAEAFRVIWPKICGDVWRTMAAEALSPSLKEQERT